MYLLIFKRAPRFISHQYNFVVYDEVMDGIIRLGDYVLLGCFEAGAVSIYGIMRVEGIRLNITSKVLSLYRLFRDDLGGGEFDIFMDIVRMCSGISCYGIDEMGYFLYWDGGDFRSDIERLRDSRLHLDGFLVGRIVPYWGRYDLDNFRVIGARVFGVRSKLVLEFVRHYRSGMGNLGKLKINREVLN